MQQSAPAGRITPRTLPPNVRVPRGRSFTRDTSRLRSSPRYYDPYDPLYYGNPASPYFYLYLAALNDNDSANPAPYQAQQCKAKKKGVSVGWVIALGIISVVLLVIIVMLIASRPPSSRDRY